MTTLSRFAHQASGLLQSIRNMYGDQHAGKQLPDFGVERVTQLLGCSKEKLTELEQRSLSTVRRVRAGATIRRVYNHNELLTLKRALGWQPRGFAQPITITFASLKGGSGKSTHAIHFAHYCAKLGLKTLVVDFDPQATTSSYFYVWGETGASAVTSSLFDEPDALEQAIRKTHWDTLDLVPAHPDLELAGWRLIYGDVKQQELIQHSLRLRRALDAVKSHYDLVIIDTQPSVTGLAINGLCAADLVITPVCSSLPDVTSASNYALILRDLESLGALRPKEFRMLITRVGRDNVDDPVIQLIKQTYDRLVFDETAHENGEIRRASRDYLSIYELANPIGPRETYHKAIAMMDGVNSALLDFARRLDHRSPVAAVDNDTSTHRATVHR